MKLSIQNFLFLQYGINATMQRYSVSHRHIWKKTQVWTPKNRTVRPIKIWRILIIEPNAFGFLFIKIKRPGYPFKVTRPSLSSKVFQSNDIQSFPSPDFSKFDLFGTDKYTYPYFTILEIFESSRRIFGGMFWVFELLPVFVLSCQNHRSKHLTFQYIYLISYKNAKKDKSSYKSLLLWYPKTQYA